MRTSEVSCDQCGRRVHPAAAVEVRLGDLPMDWQDEHRGRKFDFCSVLHALCYLERVRTELTHAQIIVALGTGTERE